MVETQLIPRGIKNQRVINAILKVPRHRFVPVAFQHQAYDDHPCRLVQTKLFRNPISLPP